MALGVEEFSLPLPAWISPRLLLSIIKHPAISQGVMLATQGTTYVTKIGPRVAQVYTLDFVALSLVISLFSYHIRVLLNLIFGGNFSHNITILAVNFNASRLQTYKPE